jgi:short-subunit dehydrogenase
MDPRDQVAVITGASRGIGQAVALALAAKGARLLLVARARDDLEQVAESCRDAGSPKVETLVADLATLDGLDAVIMTAVRSFDGFDILINNAGVGRAKPITEISDEEVEHQLALNLRAPILLTQAAIKVLRRRGGGQIVQIGSGLSYVGRAQWSLYCATKFGLRGFSEALRQEVSREGIKIGMVAPGFTDTHFFDGWRESAGITSFADALDPADVAHAVLALIEQGPRSDIREITVRSKAAP